LTKASLEHSVTYWIEELKRGDSHAAAELWRRYFVQLVSVARRKLGDRPGRVANEEDLAVDVFDSLCRGAAAGRFTELSGRDDLWRLLVGITTHKALEQRRFNARRKRGSGLVRGDSIFVHEGEHVPAGFDQFAAIDPDPGFLVELREEHERLLAALRDDTLRRVALLRMEGYSNEEIAAKLGTTVRTIERKLSLIRKQWGKEME
jgi:RNA polymerase sigma factor (sigma-70 family)